MDYKTFVLNHKKQTGQTPNQLEVEQLYQTYIESAPKSKAQIISSPVIGNVLNQAIKDLNIELVKSLISNKSLYTDNSMYFAIKTNNFELFKCVYDYVGKLAPSDLIVIKSCGNADIIKHVNELEKPSIVF